MKGVSFVANDQNELEAVQIDLKLPEKHQEALEKYPDMIIAESRSGTESVTWEADRLALKEEGKL